MNKLKNAPTLLIILLIGLLFSSLKTDIYGYNDGYYAMRFALNGNILGDEDENHEKEQEQEREREEEKENEEEQENEQEQEREQEQKQEEEKEQEENKVETQEQIVNQNGSTTYIKRQSENNKTEVELKTYDSSGKLIEERKIKQEESDDGKNEVEVESYLSKNGTLQELKVKSKEGKELEISVKSDGEKTKTSTLEYNANNQELQIKYKEQNRNLSIKPGLDYFEIDDGVSKATVRLPITVDENSGEVFVDTVVGLVRVGISPDRAVEIIKENDEKLDLSDDNIDLEEGGQGLEYRISTKKKENLLGLFPITISSEYLVDAETGTQNGVDQNFLNSILALISF